ncbi:MAG: hypothetical protein PHC88_08090 [Terrimicrobiaceae bacterium]|nr:hypothetical protein [Terrimicrobiaceae bacterium]
MAIDNTDNWFLKKHDNGEVFGPVPFGRLVEWAGTAQIAPQDALSNDAQVWTKSPMVPELKMDWIVKLDDDHYYGPTTIGSLLEFLENGEINGDTVILDCCTGVEQPFNETAFFPPPELHGDESSAGRSPSKGIIRLGLQKRIRELEIGLLEKRRQLDMAADTIHRLETRVRELDARVRELSDYSNAG